MRRGSGAAIAGALVLLLTTQLWPALANDFGPPNGQFANDRFHKVYLDTNLTSVQRSRTDWARIYALDAPTDLQTSLAPSATSFPDVWARSTSSPPVDHRNDYAWTSCSARRGDICDINVLTYNNLQSPPDAWALACHELAHTVGLGHWTGVNSSYSDADKSCLRSGPDWSYLSTHDKNHINGHY
jgi:hypothetical protein